MKFLTHYTTKRVFNCAFDTEGNTDNGNTDNGNTGDTGPVFTQEQVDRMLADAQTQAAEAVKRENAQVLQNYQRLQATAKMTGEERDTLASQIKDLEGKVFSAEELAQREAKKVAAKTQQTIDGLTSERDGWKTRFEESTISRSITDAAVAHEAYNPAQISAVLRNQTRLSEIKDEEGQVTGYEAIVSLASKDDKGNPVTLELSPEKAVEQLKEDQSYFNLFKGQTKGGLGGANSGTGGQRSLNDVSSMEDYAKNRQDILDGKIR